MKVVIISGNKYPLEDAGAIRQHSTAKLFKLLGYETLILGYGKSTHGKISVYDGINYISFRPSNNNIIIRALYRYFFIDRAVKYLKKNVKSVDVLLIVDVLPKDFKKIKNLASYYHAKLVHDSVEWYSPEEFSNGEKNRSFRNKEYTNTIAVGSGWRVIAISKYLEEHFKNKCTKVTRIPVIMDVLSINPTLTCINNKNIYVYAGGPGKKDNLKTIIDAFLMLSDAERELIEFHIIGVNRNQLIDLCGVDEKALDKLNNILFIHGRLPQKDALAFVNKASYTILIRDETLRYSKAGFPTKVVESLSCGTPVICNLSSDLNEYLVDSVNSIIVDGHRSENVYQALQHSINIDKVLYSKLRVNARKTAEQFFDYRDYVNALKELLD